MNAESAPTALEEEVRLLLFFCAGERFGVDVGFVREVLPPPPLTPVPFGPAAVAGVVNHRGQIYTAIRFSRLAQLREEPAERALVLLRLPEMSVGLLVAAVEGIVRLPAGLFAEGAPTALSFVSLLRDEGGRTLRAVDAERLIDIIYQLPEGSREAR